MKALAALLLFFIPFVTYCQVPEWNWALDVGGPGNDYFSAVKNDNSGNIYLALYFKDPVNLDDTVFTSNGGMDILLIKFNNNRDIVWIRHYGGEGDDACDGIDIDEDGYLYFIGRYFSSSIDIGGHLLNGHEIGTCDILIAKLTSDGDVIWAKGFGGADSEVARTICCAGGSVFIAGSYFSDPIVFDDEILLNAGNQDIFICRIDHSGTVVSARSFGGSGTEYINDLTWHNGFIYTIGNLNTEPVSFDGIELNSKGFDDIFITKHNEDVDCLWAKSAGGEDWDHGNSLTVDNLENIYAVGEFSSDICNFESISLVNTNPVTNSQDLFVAKYNNEGQVKWAKSFGSPVGDYNYQVAGNHENNIYVCGTYSSGFIFDTLVLGPPGGGHIFKFSMDTIQWIKPTSWASSAGMSVNGLGEIIIGGVYIHSFLDFGGISLANQGSSDVFIAELTDTPYYSEIFEPVKTNDDNGILVYPNPFHDQLTIKCKSEIDEVKIFSIDGRIIYRSVNNPCPQLPINLSCLKNGIYFLAITIKNSIFSEKIIKK